MTLQIPFCYRLLISLAFFLSTVVCLPASAGEQPVNQGPGITVKWADLDLNTDGGRRALLDRLSKAARSACAFLHGDVGYPKVYGSCYDRYACDCCGQDSRPAIVHALRRQCCG